MNSAIHMKPTMVGVTESGEFIWEHRPFALIRDPSTGQRTEIAITPTLSQWEDLVDERRRQLDASFARQQRGDLPVSDAMFSQIGMPR